MGLVVCWAAVVRLVSWWIADSRLVRRAESGCVEWMMMKWMGLERRLRGGCGCCPCTRVAVAASERGRGGGRSFSCRSRSKLQQTSGKALPLSHCPPVCVCVLPRVDCLCMFMRVFRQAATADPQAPAGPFSGRQAGRQNTARQSDWQKGRQASERVNQQRMSKGAVCGSEHQSEGEREGESKRERRSVCLCGCVCMRCSVGCVR